VPIGEEGMCHSLTSRKRIATQKDRKKEMALIWAPERLLDDQWAYGRVSECDQRTQEEIYRRNGRIIRDR
jgi:hypothetical protein